MGFPVGINLRRKLKHQDSAETVLDKFIDQVASDECPCSVHISNNLITLKILQEETRWWSPEMNLRIEREEGETVLYELIGPNPTTFTLSMFFVLFGAVVFIAAFIMMLAQIQLGMSSTWAQIGSVISVVIVVAAFVTLAIGRIKAKAQVKMLKKYAKRVMSK
jgi:hypothetical protein